LAVAEMGDRARAVSRKVAEEAALPLSLGERKGKERKSIHIALFSPRWYTQSAQAWITLFYL